MEYLPLFTNQTQLFEEKAPSNVCRKTHDVLYSANYNLCFEVQDTCIYDQLIENGFKPIDLSINKKAKALAASREISFESLEGQSDEASLASLESQDETDSAPQDLKALVQSCQIFVDINDLKTTDFLSVRPEAVGYVIQPNVMCAMSIEPLVNFKDRTCALATNGCQSAFLKKAGFVKDYYSICPES